MTACFLQAALIVLCIGAPAHAQSNTDKRPATPSGELSIHYVKSYQRWLDEDVRWIITDEERAAFLRLSKDEDRDRFIEAFWLRRDPTPGTVENEFKEEHYRRIAYANEHFSAGIPGWKTDRGRIYITYGPPDEKESHPAGNATSAVPNEQWLYHLIAGVGTNVIIEFVDPDKTGEYRMTMDPNEKDADAPPPAAQRFYIQGAVA